MRVALKTAREALTIGVIPDRVFSLAFEDRTRLNFALELDRGTMDIKSRQLVGKSSFRRKLLGYYQLWKEGLHTSQWGFKAFRVLTVTPSEKRIENMIAVQKEIVGEQGSNLFLFTTPTRLSGEIAACRCVGHRQGRAGGPPIMTAHRAQSSADLCCGLLIWMAGFWRGPGAVKGALRVPAAAFAARPLTAPFKPARFLQPYK